MRRHQTTPGINQPVRFYKLVALSFLFLTLALLSVIVFMSSKRAAIVITTKESPVDVESTISVNEGGNVGATMATTTVRLSRGFSPTGTKKEPGTAEGLVTLHNETNSAQPLVATTRLLTSDNVLFRLKDRVTVPANGTAVAAVHADEKGESGNVGPQDRFTIPGLREEKQKVIYASSDAAMTGGVKTVGVLSQTDIEKAEDQLLGELEKLGEDALQKKHPNKVGVFKVVDSSVKTEAPIGEEVSEFSLEGRATVVGVFYDVDKVQEYARGQLLKRVVDDVTVLRGGEGDASVQIKEFNLGSGNAVLSVYHSAVERLNADSKQLDKMLFFGKTKEEVRRHILTLDHVYSVDVKFKPLWVRTVPFVPEHVQIIVKTVE